MATRKRAAAAATNGTQTHEPDDDGPDAHLVDELDSDEGDPVDGDGDDDGDDDDDHSEPEPPRNGLREMATTPLPSLDEARLQPPETLTTSIPSGARRPRRGPSGAPVVPRGIRGPRGMSDEARAMSPALKSAREYSEGAYAEIDSLLGNLNFSKRQYEIRVSRIEPDTDENGVSCDGLLHTYKAKVSVDQIMTRFGGGLFEIKVWGPHPTTGTNTVIKTETFRVAGPPKPMPSFRQRDERPASDGLGEVLRAVTDANERSSQRLAQALERSKNAPSAVSELLPVIEKMLTKGDEDRRAMLDAQREERREAAERRAEERKQEETRRADERRAEEKRDEERRRLEEKRADELRTAERDRREEERRADDKRREDERKLEDRRAQDAREARAAEIEARKEERVREEREHERELLRLKDEAAERQRQHERDLQAQAERLKADQDRQKEFMTMMNTMQQAQMDMLMNRQENGGIENVTKQMLALKQLQGDLTGANDEPTKMEQITEGVQNIVQTVMPVAQQVLNAVRSKQPQQQQTTTTATATVGPAPGTRPLVVDVGPMRTALTAGQPQAQPQAQPVAQPQAQPQAFSTAGPGATPQPQPQPNPGSAGSPGEPVNEYTAITLPQGTEDFTSLIPMLVKNVDLAIRQNMTPEQIVETILEPFDDKASMLMSLASGLSAEELIEFITANVPPSWAIMSPRGEEIVVASFELWRQKSTIDDEQPGVGE